MLSFLFGAEAGGTATAVVVQSLLPTTLSIAGFDWQWPLLALVMTCLAGMVALAARVSSYSPRREETERHATGACATTRKLAWQAAHDIRSPLSALQWLLEQAGSRPRERQLLELAIARLHRVADDLSATAQPETKHEPFTLVNWTLHSVLQERRLNKVAQPTWRVSLGPGTESAGVSGLRRELAIALHALLDSVSASGENMIWNVSLSLASESTPSILVDVSLEGPVDTSIVGNGAPAPVIPRASERLERLAAVIGSTPGGGARLTVPLAPPPMWLLCRFTPAANRQHVILDDDTWVHSVWREKLPQHARVHLTSPLDFRIDEYPPSQCEYWFDHDLVGTDLSGLDLIQVYGLGSQAVLVTSRFEEPDIQARVARLGARLLPKFLLPLLPVASRVPEALRSTASPPLA